MSLLTLLVVLLFVYANEPSVVIPRLIYNSVWYVIARYQLLSVVPKHLWGQNIRVTNSLRARNGCMLSHGGV